MPLRSLADLQPGMVLAADAESPDGNHRLTGGTSLTETHIRMLRGWHLREIEVEAPPPPQDAPTDDAPEDAAQAVLSRFVHLPGDNPFVIELRRQALARADTRVPPKACRPARRKPDAPAGVPAPEKILTGDPVLVSLPEVFMRIREVLSDPSSTIEEAAAVIGKDPSLTAKLLKLVNSAFYARTLRVSGSLPPASVDTLTRAVMLLGLNQLSTLAMGVSVLPLFRDIPPDCVDLRQFWQHSIGVGLVAKILSARLGDPSPERYFVAGLLHDIGRLVLYKRIPDVSGEALARAAESNRHLVVVERETFGFDHAELGGMLLRKWRFPESLEQTVWRHHDPMAADVPLEPAIINVADMVAVATLAGGSGERLIPEFIPQAWRLAAISPSDLPEIVAMAESHLEVVCAMFA
ncbi:HDOD domain-containing protein [Desulfovibrio sp. JY]|nr:HDOD domain-containing protein [Desulfovibrio sp. JY]